jgi:hypothetical protein
MPTAGRIVFRALLHQGRRSAEGEAEVLGVGDHPLSQLFFAAHDVIGELRLISEAR